MTTGTYSTSASLSLKGWKTEAMILPSLKRGDDEDEDGRKMDILPIPVVQTASRSAYSHGTKSRTAGKSVKRFWRWFVARTGGDDIASTAADTSITRDDESIERERVSLENLADDGHTVDVVVVDRDWAAELDKKLSSTTADDRSPEFKSSASPPDSAPTMEGHREISTRLDPPPWWLQIWLLCYHRCVKFFLRPSPAMHKDLEDKYNDEDWKKSKKLAWWASLWLMINWGLGVAAALPRDLPDRIFHYGIAPVFSIPVLFMVMADMPRKRPIFYQCSLCVSTWMWAFYYTFYMFLCGFYDPRQAVFTCLPGKDFQAIFYYTIALQTITLFGLKLHRISAAFGALVYFIFAFVTIVPDREVWWRSLINFAVFHCFLLFIHYRRECADRKLYQMQNELKVQIRRREKAQENERRASEGKRRLTSYVFHEVRVPLNIALLAAQNLESAGTIVKDLELEFHALKASLDSMTQVLNDVLDFNRMDSGHFEIADKPFPLHKALRSLHFPLKLAAESRGQKFVMKFDSSIDRVARVAAYKALGQSKEAIMQQLERHPDVSGVVIGDETQ